MLKPDISVIIPCYNQAQYLDECLQSVLHQTHQNWECIIINDGSTDTTREQAHKWVEKDRRFLYIEKINEGVTKTRNLGLEKSKGKWIQFLDADDLLFKTKLEKSLNFADNANLIITNFDMIDSGAHIPGFCDLSKKEINFYNILKGWDVNFNIPIHSALISKDLLEDTIFKKHLKAKEDWIFWLELLHKPIVKVKFIDEVLASYRENKSGASKNLLAVYKDMQEAHTFLYNKYDGKTKAILFEKLNEINVKLSEIILKQKQHIIKLENTKILKAYLKIRNSFTKFK